jgi:probable F420-dependent oxidoreductase
VAETLPVSVGYANYQPALHDLGALRAFCQALEELGYHGIQVQDHVAYPWDQEAYAYSAGGTLAHHPGQRMMEALTFLAAAAACSSRLALEASVIVLTQRHPLLVAKQAASIDALSGGRLLLGVGPGWLQAEIRALGWDPATRGARMDEALEVLVRALDDEHVRFTGEHFDFEDISLEPRPRRSAREMLWIGGGESGALSRAMRRLGRWGTGWLVNPRLPFEEIPAALQLARQEAESAGRGRPSFGIDLNIQFDGDPQKAADAMQRRLEAGGTRVSVFLGGLTPADTVDALIDLAVRFAEGAGLRRRT